MTTKTQRANDRPDEATISRWQNALKFTHGREEAAARIVHWRREYRHYRKVTEAEWDAARATYAHEEEGFDLETFEYLVVVEPPLTMEAAERTMAGREGIKTSHTFFDRSTSPPTVNIAKVLEIDQAAGREILYHLDAVDPYFQPTFLPLEALQPGYRGPRPRRRSLSTKRAQTQEREAEAARGSWETAIAHAAERGVETPHAEWLEEFMTAGAGR
ncbi:hypothetical protein CPLU01_14849 [Colletotrichum plurivorum]|uniref:Uncharacterized protein n=1 Tax=Colletotrichum plurivorum TaxID=2175906 RepID=A0A8H6MY90_9PEZI|nr:hypothetical protein CPLU01_14849 [Colletotrichum plurivorum]